MLGTDWAGTYLQARGIEPGSAGRDVWENKYEHALPLALTDEQVHKVKAAREIHTALRLAFTRVTSAVEGLTIDLITKY